MDVLAGLAPVSEEYASLPIAEAFNWEDAGRGLAEGEWYLVAFRSIRRSDADEEMLRLYDEAAHEEAEAAPGFVHYFKGPTAPDGSCLSFCLWTSRPDARSAARKPAHQRAVGLLEAMYQQYTLEFQRVSRIAGGLLTFETYDRPTPVPVDPLIDPLPEPLADGPTLGLTVGPAAAF
ncbi:MAG TPA: hypothetical protein VHS36_03125 [Candidatus Limnocylindrales bacterium]|jgi:hypothetical protein|nr:hypothetical protein [Candidatus Limnocylindrales bacterium]